MGDAARLFGQCRSLVFEAPLRLKDHMFWKSKYDHTLVPLTEHKFFLKE